MEIVIQRFLSKALLAMPNYHDKCWFVNCCRDDYIRDKKYERWLFNEEEWTQRTSIEFVTYVGPVILTCLNHSVETKKIISILQGNPTMFFLQELHNKNN